MSSKGIETSKTILLNTLRTGFYMFCIIFAVACSGLFWKFIEIYAKSVKAEEIKTQIMLEQHNMMLKEIHARRDAASKFEEEERQGIESGYKKDQKSAPTNLGNSQ